MTEHMVIEYLANSAWQIPLLAVGAWVLVKLVRPGVLVEHWVWLSVLAMAVVLPMRGVERRRIVPAAPSAKSDAVAVALLAASLSHEVTRPVGSLNAHEHGVVLSVAATRWVLGLYAGTLLFGILRLLNAWRAARRLVWESIELVLPPHAMDKFEACRAKLHAEPPLLRETYRIAGPVVVGAMRPVLLLPERFAEHAEEEIRAALLHEFAHVRRRDYLVNLACQVAALPVAWHPAMWSIQRRIRMTREMVCDRIAAEEMGSGAEYSRCLLSLAMQMLGKDVSIDAVGLFQNGTMEERVMRLTDSETTETMSGRTKLVRVACGAAVMLAVTLAAATFHVRPTFAATEAASASVATMQATAQATAPATPAAVAKPSAAVPSAEAQRAGSPSASSPKVVEDGATVVENDGALVEDDGPTATAGPGAYVHRWVGADGKKYVVVNHDPKEPNAEERLKQEQKLKVSLKQLDGLQMKLDVSGMKLDELQKGLANIDMKQLDMAKQLANDPKMKLQMDALQKQINDPAWRKQIADASKAAQLKVFESPELKKQMDDLQKQMNDPAWQKQIADAGKNAQLVWLKSPEWKKQFAELEKNAASVNAEQQLEIAKSAIDRAKIDAEVSAKISAEVKVEMAKAQKELTSGELKAKLDAAQQLLDEARKQMQEMQKK